jgi:hypothetical protein
MSDPRQCLLGAAYEGVYNGREGRVAHVLVAPDADDSSSRVGIRLHDGDVLVYTFDGPASLTPAAAHAAARVLADHWTREGVTPCRELESHSGLPRRGVASASARRRWGRA